MSFITYVKIKLIEAKSPFINNYPICKCGTYNFAFCTSPFINLNLCVFSSFLVILFRYTTLYNSPSFDKDTSIVCWTLDIMSSMRQLMHLLTSFFNSFFNSCAKNLVRVEKTIVLDKAHFRERMYEYTVRYGDLIFYKLDEIKDRCFLPK